jgi:fluoride exporter
MPTIPLVMIQGTIGAGLRFEAGRLASSRFGLGFPSRSFFVNFAGGFLLGTWPRHGGVGEPLRLFRGVGILGGFTIFSAFSIELLNMVQRGNSGRAGRYVYKSVVGSVLAFAASLMLAWVAA